MSKIDKLKLKLTGIVMAEQEHTPEFIAVVQRLATAISDEREGLKVYRVDYVRQINQSGCVWVKATDVSNAKDVAQEVLDEGWVEEDERVVRFADAEDNDDEVSITTEDASEDDDVEEVQ